MRRNYVVLIPQTHYGRICVTLSLIETFFLRGTPSSRHNEILLPTTPVTGSEYAVLLQSTFSCFCLFSPCVCASGIYNKLQWIKTDGNVGGCGVTVC